MSGVPTRTLIRTNCLSCSAEIIIDPTDYAPNTAIKLNKQCPRGHVNEINIKNALIFNHSLSGKNSEIDYYINVPPHIKTLIHEGYQCVNHSLPIAGIGVVRKIFDEILYHCGYQTGMLGQNF